MIEKLKLTLGQIGVKDAEGKPVFMLALQKLRKQPLGKDAYAVGKCIKTIESEYAAFSEAYASIVKKYGKETTPNSWMIDRSDKDNFAKAEAEISELVKKEFEIYLDRKIKLPDVGSVAEQFMLTADDAMLLEPLITD